MADAPPTDSAAGRVGAALGGAALTGIAAWLACLNLSRFTLDGWIFWAPVTLWLLTMGVLCWRAALSRDQTATRDGLRTSWKTGWTVGAIGLVAGFVGPLVFSTSNLGPLLGILITGPLGFVAGALGAGVVRGMR